jgi:hypothetical protein
MSNVLQYAGDARVPFAFGGSGEGRISIPVDWDADELTLANVKTIFTAAKACYISNFAIYSEDMDSHATPTLEWDLGVTGNTDALLAGDALTIGELGGHSVLNSTSEANVAGTVLEADAVVLLSVLIAAATGAAGTVTVSFDVAEIHNAP